ncbi:MAG: hypothetical protein QF444_02210, partial [Phycisphaerales bacterium]|nr:hypothetical protein [Phycisphaerales bacterium]
SVGDKVNADKIVAATYMPGDVYPLNMANLLAVPPKDVVGLMLHKEGEKVEEGEPIAETAGLFGKFKKKYNSPYAGTIETVSDVTGQVILRGPDIPIEVKAYIAGTVTKVNPEIGCTIEADVAFVQGIFGIGGETCGPIKFAVENCDETLTASNISADMKGCVVIGGARLTDEAIEEARKVGAVALIGGGMDDQDLKDFLGYDLGVAITGSEKKGITVIVTEGFGDIAMATRTFDLLKRFEGHSASVNGATQIRAGVMRPEIIIPLATGSSETEPQHTGGYLEIGKTLRIIRDPYFGVIGKVKSLPHEPHALDSGSRARVLEVELNSGESVIVPRANVELIEA